MKTSIPFFFAAATVLGAGPALAQDLDVGTSLDDIPHITLVGSAHEEVAPDLAIISLGVVTEKPTAVAASQETGRETEAVVAAAKSLGVGAADIQTQALTLTQMFDTINSPNGSTQKPRGFEAANVVRLRIHDLAKAGSIAQTLIEKGANRFDGIEFAVEHPEPLQSRLMAQAVRNARMQAQAVVDAAGVKLGRVLQIEQPSSGGDAPARTFQQAKMATAPSSMPIEAGTSTASAAIEVTWALN